MYRTTYLPNTRLQVADALRGLAIIGITLLHNVWHLHFVRPPEITNGWIAFFDKIVWEDLSFAFEGKMYSIFTLMFGLSFFIQNDNQMQRGNDFTFRFRWRMTLLLVFGIVNTFFFSGDILFSYALFGMMLPFFSKLSTKTVAIITCLLLLLPVEIYQFIAALFNPDYQLIHVNNENYSNIIANSQQYETFWKCGWNNLKYGQLINFAWDIEGGRITLIPGLFLLGMILGRLRLFYNEKNNLKIWFAILVISLVSFALFYKITDLLPNYISRTELLTPVWRISTTWSNLAQTSIYISIFVLLFYSFKTVNRWMLQLTFLGRASMTNYIMQSVLGSILYFGWGFNFYQYFGPAISFLIGIVVVITQYWFCRWWFKTHKHGPLEGLWKKLTWYSFRSNALPQTLKGSVHARE